MAADITAMRALLHSVLQPVHAKEFRTEESVGPLIDALKHQPIKDALIALFRLNSPPDEPSANGSGSANPHEDGADGTGGNSTLTLEASG